MNEEVKKVKRVWIHLDQLKLVKGVSPKSGQAYEIIRFKDWGVNSKADFIQGCLERNPNMEIEHVESNQTVAESTEPSYGFED